MRVLKSNRLVRGNPLSASSENKKFTQEIELVNKLQILGFTSQNSFDIAVPNVLNIHRILVIKESGINDGVYAILSIVENTDASFRVTVKRAHFNLTVLTTGYMIQAKEVSIVHGLNATVVDFTLKNVVDDCYYSVDTKQTDNNTIVLMPHMPVEGAFVVFVRS